MVRSAAVPRSRKAKKSYNRKAKTSSAKSLTITQKKQVRTLVKAGIHKIAENKIFVQSLTSISGQDPNAAVNIFGSGCNWNGLVGTTGLVFQTVFPPLLLGSGQGAREGNQIEPRSFTLRGVITSQPYTAGNAPAIPAPFYVHMFIYRQKGNIFASDVSKILQGAGPSNTQQSGNSGPFDGTLLKSTYPINRDLYNVYKHKVFRMQYYPQGTLVNSPTGNNTDISDGYGNGFKMSHIFKINIPVKKSWKYNDSDTNLPTNDNFNVMFAVVNADNTQNSLAVARCALVMESVLHFEDV